MEEYRGLPIAEPVSVRQLKPAYKQDREPNSMLYSNYIRRYICTMSNNALRFRVSGTSLYMYVATFDLVASSPDQAYHLGLTTPNHVWFFPAWFEQEWWRDLKDLKDLDGEGKNCTVEQVSVIKVHVYYPTVDACAVGAMNLHTGSALTPFRSFTLLIPLGDLASISSLFLSPPPSPDGRSRGVRLLP